MKLFEKIKNMIYRAARPAAGADDEKLLEWLGISRTPKKVLSEVTYFTCLKMLSETLAKMPIKFYQQTDNSEMQNISFYIDTELFILKQYEEELDYKLLEPSDRRQGKYYKFNENVILRTDAKSQATILTGYVQNGIYTPNEARSYMNKPRKEGGDELICNGNYIKVAQIGIEEKKEGGGDNG